jgi:hypothetical protein
MVDTPCRINNPGDPDLVWIHIGLPIGHHLLTHVRPRIMWAPAAAAGRGPGPQGLVDLSCYLPLARNLHVCYDALACRKVTHLVTFWAWISLWNIGDSYGVPAARRLRPQHPLLLGSLRKSSCLGGIRNGLEAKAHRAGGYTVCLLLGLHHRELLVEFRRKRRWSNGYEFRHRVAARNAGVEPAAAD